jgi:hypothetical protein
MSATTLLAVLRLPRVQYYSTSFVAVVLVLEWMHNRYLMCSTIELVLVPVLALVQGIKKRTRPQ